MVASAYSILPQPNACTSTHVQSRLARKHLPCHDRQRRTSRILATPSEDRPSQFPEADGVGRIWKAAKGDNAQAPEAVPPVTELDRDAQRLNDQVSSFAASAAASEEQAFTAALTDMQQQGESTAQAPPPRPPFAPPQPPKSGQDLREAAMRRIAEARKYVGATGARSLGMQARPAQASAPPRQGSALDAPPHTSAAVEWGQSGVGTSEQVSCWPLSSEAGPHACAGVGCASVEVHDLSNTAALLWRKRWIETYFPV